MEEYAVFHALEINASPKTARNPDLSALISHGGIFTFRSAEIINLVHP